MSAQVFISYAHADDASLDEQAPGWITNFVEKLQKAIGMKSGGKHVEWWMDYELEPQSAVDGTLRQRILESQCILAFLSPRYLESEWCQREMATFVELAGSGKAENRVFLVELQPTDRERWHPGIQSISVLQFWSKSLAEPEPMTLGWPVPDPKSDKTYWRELNYLASILARQVQGLPPTLPSPPPLPPTPPLIPVPAVPAASASPNPSAAKTLWVADPTDDMLDCWESLAAALQGHQLLPKNPGQYPNHDETLYRQALSFDLAQADLLIQLLGGSPGRKPVWADSRFVQILADAAKDEAQRRNVPFLAWRSPDVAIENIKDPAYKTLLENTMGLAFEDFCQEVVKQMAMPTAAVSQTPLNVVINADKPDRDLGRQVQDLLADLEVDATLAAEPLPTQLPAEYRQHLEEQLEVSHGVLLVYGSAPPSWVQSQHALARKVLALHRKGVWGALLDGPPEQKPDHGISKRSLMLLDCRRGLTTELLKQFTDTLREGV